MKPGRDSQAMNDGLKRQIWEWARRVWNSPGVIGVVLGVGAWGFGLSRINELKRESPALPELMYGETVPVRWGSGMVYMTARDATFVHWFPFGGMAAILVVFALFSWREHRNKDRD